MLGFVVRRLRGRLPLAAAVLLTVLITTTVLTALFAFTRGVGEAGLRQALQGPDHARSTVLVTGGHPAADRSKDDEAVRGFADKLFGPFPSTTESVARSRSYGLPGLHAQRKDADLTLLAAFAKEHVRLLAGAWPQPVTGPVSGQGSRVPVAVPKAALVRLGLTENALPAEVRLDGRNGVDSSLTVLVTGVYAASDPDAAYWKLDPLGARGLQVGNFATYGPLLADDSAFTTGGLAQDSRAVLLTPDFATADINGTEAVRARATKTAEAFQRTSGLHPTTELPVMLGELESGLTVARSTLLVGALQLAVLAGAALLLVSHLLTERQESERVLLTARGASRRRLALLTAAQSLLLALPAAALAPLLALPLLRLLGGYGSLDRIPFTVTLSPSLWPVAVGCALGCVLLTTLPVVLGAATAALRRTGRRQALVTGAARSGLDLALVALAVLAYQQLSRYGSNGSTPAPSSADPSADPSGALFGVDPLLVAAPTLALCAGTLLVLRLLPFAARLGARIASRGRGLGPALVGWQLARRPRRATGPVLLLVLAVASGTFALGQHTTWSQSQRDQADFTTAGGLLISGSDLPPMGRAGRYGALPGGEQVIPTLRAKQELPGGRTAQVMALDAAAVAERVPLRPDLRNGRSLRELFAPLVSTSGRGAAAASGIPLPDSPQRIDLAVAVRGVGAAGRASVGLMLRDRFGITYRSPLAQLPEDGEATVSVNLDSLVGAPLGSAATPLHLAGLVFTYDHTRWNPDIDDVDTPDPSKRFDELTIRSLAVSQTRDGAAVPVVAATSDWRLTAPALNHGAPSAESLPASAAGGVPALARLRYHAGPFEAGGVLVTLAPPAAAESEVPGIATRAYLAAVGAAVGDLVPVKLGDATVPVRVTAAVGTLPVAGDTAITVDLATASRVLAAGGLELPAPTEWWMPAASADDPAPARAAAELRSTAGVQQVRLREEVARTLLDDPLSAGPQGALAALAVACAVLAAIGFAASAAAASRERAREFSVLLALGARRRDLAWTATAESCVLVGLGTVAGLGLGGVIVHLVVPLMVLTPTAGRPMPEVLVDLPTARTLLLAAAIAAVPLLSAVVGGLRNRNTLKTADRLRHMEEI
ncbi:FtsX-like permease family protein [Streptomyces sp. NBC_00503]|uniref:FtsX-like permease family protein n=1 Tax=Streptomyces sp. NBC_00503 TaxID=2903659 RepID=UPI002E7FEFC8|nr:FtsX-like permease family protein [Streptomyces sp. NBC_00503]WUD79777.1 FtsX-like permease family protein [Streptomyces sp. NBC_00503]